MPWEDVKAIFRPEGVHMGIMRADPVKCTRPRGSSCQLCHDNCPFRAWELVERQEPRLKDGYACFSCYNCLIACPRHAIEIVEPYHVDDGFFKTLPGKLEAMPPRPPLDSAGNPDEWTVIEKAIFNRRSVRNFNDKPVPEPLIRRVLEAGRFAPSAGNSQPWRFIVITDKAVIGEIDEAVWMGLNLLYQMYMNDDMVQPLATGYELSPEPGMWDPRLVIGGMGSIAARNAPALLDAPAVILILGDERAISEPHINIGIAGQNMNLTANSLGLGCCWVGFTKVVNHIAPLKEKLGIEPPWTLVTSMVLGYPRFKQEGVVPREYRPVTWFREGAAGPDED